jgi:hypothetical protein
LSLRRGEQLVFRRVWERQQDYMSIAGVYDFFLSGTGYDTNDLDAEMVGNTKCSQKISIETIDATVLATPLRGKRN